MTSLVPYVYECPLNELTLARAAELAPREFAPAWKWFQEMEGGWIPRLPRGNDAPEGIPVKLAAQRGIHTPSIADLSEGWKNDRRYALTIYSSGGKRYADKSVIQRPDGTWLFDYTAQKTEQGRETQWDQNEPLLNCLNDGVPVGVLIGQPGGGYKVMGLAFVERFNEKTGFFTLHGPINMQTENNRLFYSFVDEELTDKDRIRLQELKQLALSNGDERVRVFERGVRRAQQSMFRSAVYDAYEGKCAACSTTIDDILQAAHIDDYRGRKSQIVQNGILLRVDIHMLYDANLIGIEPDTHRIRLSSAINLEPYGYLENHEISLPRNSLQYPDDELLEIHFKQFLAQDAVA